MAIPGTPPGWLDRPWMPPDAALHGPALDHLLRLNLLFVCAILLAAHLVLFAAILRRPASRAHRRGVLLVESLVFALVAALFVWMGISSQSLWARSRYAGPSPAALQVEVTGVQFQWYFRYPGEDAAFGRTRAELADAGAGNPLGIDPADEAGLDDLVSSQLVLPAGREVDLALRAQDVIHGFDVPALRVKQDAVPGMLLHIHFTPLTPGEYPILCTQLCGLGHQQMQATARVIPAAQYAVWLAIREKTAAGSRSLQ